MPNRNSTPTPHDAYFKLALQNPQAAKHMLMRYLPPETLALIDDAVFRSLCEAKDSKFPRVI